MNPQIKNLILLATEGGPAFPHAKTYVHGSNDLMDVEQRFDGMSLRDYFAANAPKPPESFERAKQTDRKPVPAPELGLGWMKAEDITIYETEADYLARWNYAYADAMLKAKKYSETKRQGDQLT